MKKITAVFLALCFLMPLCGCRSGKKRLVIYFGSEEGHSLAEEEVYAEEELSPEEEALFALGKLLEGPNEQEHKRVIPEGTTLISLKVKDRTATVNLSQELEKTNDNSQRLLALYSVVATLCSVDGIRNAQILVNGRNVKYNSSGEDIGLLSMNNVITDDEIIRKQTLAAEFYFGSEDGEGLCKQNKMIDVKNNEAIEKTIINELLNGPDDEKRRLIPSDVKLLSVETKDKLCYLNMSKEFAAINPDDAYMAVYSVVNTLTAEWKKTDGVQFLINGERVDSIGGVDLSKPLYYNSGIVKEN